MKVTSKYIEIVCNEFIGIPYRNCGRDPKVGLDCWGLVLAVYSAIGIVLKDPAKFYEEEWWRDKDLITDNAMWDFYKVDVPRIGDVVSLRIGDSNVANHVALVVGVNYILNCDNIVGVHKMRAYPLANRVMGYHRCKVLEIDDYA